MIILALGSNLGNSRQALKDAIQHLEKQVSITRTSALYTSQAWGFESTETFYNQVITGETKLEPLELLDFVKSIEKEMGRKAKVIGSGYIDRIIDIDIIAYNTLHMESERLNIPHILMQERNFVLNPLVEIAPNWQHPILKKTAIELQKECKDSVISTRI